MQTFQIDGLDKFFAYSFTKQIAYVRNYENLQKLKAAIAVAFEEIIAEMISSVMSNLKNRLHTVVELKGGYVENKVT